MLRKITPINFGDSAEEIAKQLNSQSEKRGYQKSLDPENFPVFDPQPNKKYLIYVPNHVVVNSDGVEELLMDKPLIHNVSTANSYGYYRCIYGLVLEKYGLDGSCPLCDGTSEPWDLANLQIESRCAQLNLDPKDTENPTVKSIRSTAFSKRAIDNARRYYTFPIVVIATENDDGKTLVLDENKQLSMTPMWYHVSESYYNEKWLKLLEGMEDEPTHPGGRFFMLNYYYTPKSGEPNKRDAVRNMVVSARTKIGLSDTKKLCEALDAATAEWTPMKAQSTVVSNVISPVSVLAEIADEALLETRNLLEMDKNMKQAAENGTPAIETGEKLVPPSDATTGGEVPGYIETDLDIE